MSVLDLLSDIQTMLSDRSLTCREFSPIKAFLIERKKPMWSHLEVFDHIGLFADEPSGMAGLPFIESSEGIST